MRVISPQSNMNISKRIYLNRLLIFRRMASDGSLTEWSHVARFQPTKGGTYLELPKELKAKKACRNIKNDNKCFAASITEAIFPRKKHAERYNELKRNMKKLNWDIIPC